MNVIEWVLVAVLAWAVAYGVSKASAKVLTARVVRAQQFQLLSKDGRASALLAHLPDGSFGLALRDADGSVRASLMLNSAGNALLGLADGGETVRIVMGVGEEGNAEVRVIDGQGSTLWQVP